MEGVCLFNFALFNCLIIFLVTIDFLIISKNQSTKTSVILTIFWIVFGLLFSLFVYVQTNNLENLYEYLSAYFIEKSLSLDNIFVFLMIFSKFNIEHKYQHKVLFIGIWSALFLRYLMIFIISGIVNKFNFMIPVFGVLLLYTGISSMVNNEEESSIKMEKFFKGFSKYISTEHKGNFFLKEDNGWKPTILILVLMMIEISDIIFAFDSIPAIFSVTSNRDIIYMSNAFAIIGLRSLYGVFSSVIMKMHYLKSGVNIILCAVGLKMILSDVLSIGAVPSLIFILSVLFGSYLMSVYYHKG